jgi:hypothetical protein
MGRETCPNTSGSLRVELQGAIAGLVGRDQDLQKTALVIVQEPHELARIALPCRRLFFRISRLLRGRLSQRQSDCDWRASLAATLGLPLGTALLPLTTGILPMKTSMKVALVAAVLCIGSLYLYRGDDPAPPATVAPDANQAVAVVASDAAANSTDPAIDRTQATIHEFDGSKLTHPYELELIIHVVDEIGLPIRGFTPKLGPVGGALRGASQDTDATGTVSVRWSAKQPTVDMDVRDPRRHRRRVTVRHGASTHVTLIGDNAQAITVQISGGATFRIVSHAITTQLLSGSATTTKMTAGLHPHAVFSENGLVAVVPPRADTSVGHDRVTLGQMISGNGLGSFTLDGLGLGKLLSGTSRPDDKIEPPASCTVDGFVYGEDGKPVSGAPVMLLGSGPQPLQREKTDEHGAFHFEDILANTYEVRAGGNEAGLATTSMRVDKGTYTQDLHLLREACIRGSLRDETDTAIAGATIEWLSEDGQWADRTTTDDHGAYLLANLPSMAGSLYAWHKNSEFRFPIAHMNGVRPDSGNVAITCDLTKNGTLRVQPEKVTELGLKGLRLLARHADTGISRTISVPRTKVKSIDNSGKEREEMTNAPNMPWELKSLPAGFYDLEVWLAGSGQKNLGRHWVDGKSKSDLGMISLAKPGLVHFDLPSNKMPEDLKVEITSLRDSFDVRIESLKTLADDVKMAQGNYVLATRRGEEPPQFQTFEVTTDATTVLLVRW